MLWGRVTYEMMESYWPAVARGDEEAPPALREWAVKLEAKPKYVVSSTRKDFPWTNSHHIAGDLREGVQKLKDATPAGVLLGSGKLATELDRLDLIDEYKLLVHPRIAGHGPTLYQAGCPARASSSCSRRSRSATARWPCTTAARAESQDSLVTARRRRLLHPIFLNNVAALRAALSRRSAWGGSRDKKPGGVQRIPPDILARPERGARPH
jgi:dihydrofolate reductase